MMPFYLLMLAGVSAGYYAGIFVVKRLGRRDNSLVPVVAAVTGGMAAYCVALIIAPTGSIEWSTPVRQVFDQDQLDAALAEAPTQTTLVDFYADWCGPCHRSAKNLNELADAGARIIVIDVERSPWMADRYDVAALPTTIAFLGGQEVKRVQGYKSKRELERLLIRTTGS